jgi:hypothetical protein
MPASVPVALALTDWTPPDAVAANGVIATPESPPVACVMAAK